MLVATSQSIESDLCMSAHMSPIDRTSEFHTRSPNLIPKLVRSVPHSCSATCDLRGRGGATPVLRAVPYQAVLYCGLFEHASDWSHAARRSDLRGW